LFLRSEAKNLAFSTAPLTPFPPCRDRRPLSSRVTEGLPETVWPHFRRLAPLCRLLHQLLTIHPSRFTRWLLPWPPPPASPFDRQSPVLSSKKTDFSALSVAHASLVITFCAIISYDLDMSRLELPCFIIREIYCGMYSIPCYNLDGVTRGISSRYPLCAAKSLPLFKELLMDRTRRVTCTLSECRTPPDDNSPPICNIPFRVRPTAGPAQARPIPLRSRVLRQCARPDAVRLPPKKTLQIVAFVNLRSPQQGYTSLFTFSFVTPAAFRASFSVFLCLFRRFPCVSVGSLAAVSPRRSTLHAPRILPLRRVAVSPRRSGGYETIAKPCKLLRSAAHQLPFTGHSRRICRPSRLGRG
jgi:hypothetical protein